MPAEQETTPDYLDQLERYYGVRSDNDSHNLMLLVNRVRQLEAELLAAQERLEVEQIANKNQYDQLVAAQEREKALREALERYKNEAPNHWKHIAEAALAASPSEKPDAEHYGVTTPNTGKPTP